MQSDKLATIAAAGLVFIAGVPATALAIALYRPVRRWLAPRLPRPAATGATGALLLVLVGVGVLATFAAFSRADWQVLDLAPFVSLALAVVAGVAHGIFWYRTYPGRRAAVQVPASALSHVLVIAIVVALLAASRLSESSPAFAAADQGSLGLRLALRIARAATDRDGDGFSARFGGGDCDDRRADVYPGPRTFQATASTRTARGATRWPSPKPTRTRDDGAADATPPRPAQVRSPANRWWLARRHPARAPRRPGRSDGKFKGNILIITIDALRGDRLGVAGYRARRASSLTPNLDALAQRGAYFRGSGPRPPTRRARSPRS